jgi:hypothetical protein
MAGPAPVLCGLRDLHVAYRKTKPFPLPFQNYVVPGTCSGSLGMRTDRYARMLPIPKGAFQAIRAKRDLLRGSPAKKFPER